MNNEEELTLAYDRILRAFAAMNNNDLGEAARLVSEAEKALQPVQESATAVSMRANLGGLMIDLGSWTNDEGMLAKGTEFTKSALTDLPEDSLRVGHYYNAANGYLALWQMKAPSAFAKGKIDPSHLEALLLFRAAAALCQSLSKKVDPKLESEVYVNLANCLDSVGRSMEAIQFYDKALLINPSMGEALGNKGVTLHYLAPLAIGYTHFFLQVSFDLLDKALRQSLHERTSRGFEAHHSQLQSIIEAHEDMQGEKDPQVARVSEFHAFHQDFCLKHRLFLTPSSLIGGSQRSPESDSMFISRMVAPLDDEEKFPRFITFLNQIKQDFILARLLLVQSQYRSEDIEAIDREVTLYYPVDYSVHSSYIQMLKASQRIAVDVLDKIAVFARDYCGITSLRVDRVNFRNLWSMRETPLELRQELAIKANWFLYALFSLSLDLAKGGHFESVYQARNTLTHRFLIVHDGLGGNGGLHDVPKIDVHELLNQTIMSIQIARAAVMYLILFVDLAEGGENGRGPQAPVPGYPIDDTFRWVP